MSCFQNFAADAANAAKKKSVLRVDFYNRASRGFN